ncbi:MAG: tRNA uridine-5-carboxymethylaminomethyl(34) synthesis GTPase MnmE [Oscillospiraceae bacterium]|nr:tRNA uridine-5-carboxymethylaminomethyl(34) synthesis GTPase MnmE [Oscillospiraceae bacterium]
MPDTIAAIATANAPGGIGIVRVSGPAAFVIAEKIFMPKRAPDWRKIKGYTMAYGNVGVPLEGGAVGEAICLFFREPASYTGEDVVELQCHGGPLLLAQVLRAALEAGARMAGPGEFTRRAWLNGRIGLAQAEAVMRLITAQSEQALRAAYTGIGGALGQEIKKIRDGLIALAAHIAAWMDYPDEDISPLRDCEAEAVLGEAEAALTGLIERSKGAQAVLEGVSAALVGRPNVGKSSLLNRLAGWERAIVTALPGTTRDTVTETVQLGNLTLRLTDTAGLRDTEHPVEKAGVERSLAAMKSADLVLVVLDASEGILAEDRALLGQCDLERTIVVCNKIDLVQGRPEAVPCKHVVYTSAVTGEGLDDLAKTAEEICQTAGFAPGEAMLATQRQAQCAVDAHAAVREALAALELAPDAVSVCLEDAVQALFTLTGERAGDAVVDEVFRAFCVGK